MYPLLIDITDIAMTPGATKVILVEEPLSGLRGALGWVDEDEPVKIDLLASSVSDGIQVTGEVSGLIRLNCSRCLADYEEGFERKVDETFYFEDGDLKDGYEVDGEMIDLEPMLRDAIVLNIPVHPLHSEDCKGLCSVCGTDRNINDCGHSNIPIDIRWEPLRDLLAGKASPGTKEEM